MGVGVRGEEVGGIEYIKFLVNSEPFHSQNRIVSCYWMNQLSYKNFFV